MEEQINTLTPREQEVSEFVIAGMRNQEIAAQLSISVRTIEKHVQNILTKMRMSDRRELMFAVLQHRQAKLTGADVSSRNASQFESP